MVQFSESKPITQTICECSHRSVLRGKFFEKEKVLKLIQNNNNKIKRQNVKIMLSNRKRRI